METLAVSLKEGLLESVAEMVAVAHTVNVTLPDEQPLSDLTFVCDTVTEPSKRVALGTRLAEVTPEEEKIGVPVPTLDTLTLLHKVVEKDCEVVPEGEPEAVMES